MISFHTQLVNSEIREQAWAKMFAEAFGNFFKICGCPAGLSYQTRGQLSGLVPSLLPQTSLVPMQMMPIPTQHLIVSLQKHHEMPEKLLRSDSFFRNKNAKHTKMFP